MGFGNFAVLTHVPFTLFGFFCQDVTLKTLLMGYLPGRRYLEPFLGAGVCFYLWHFKCFLNYTFEAFPISRDPWRASSGNFVSLIEGRKDKGFELCNKSNFQKYPISNNTASVFDIILRIYAQVE